MFQLIHLEFLVEDIAHHAQPALAVVVIDIAVDFILVNLLGEQFCHDIEEFGATAIEGKGSRIGHDAAIDGHGKMLAHALKASQFPHHAEHQFAGRAQERMGDDQVERKVGVGMMVDDDLRSSCSTDGLSHQFRAVESIEVETEDEVCIGNQGIRLILAPVIAHNLLRVGQPLQKIGHHIGNNHGHLLALLAQVFSPA